MRTSIAVMLLSLSPASLQAGIIYSNLGPGDSFSPGNHAVSGSNTTATSEFHVAAPFTPTFDAQFDSAEMALGLFNSTGTNRVFVELRNDDGSGLPGTVIESFTLDGVLTGPELLRTVNSTLHPGLTQGTQYWLAVLPGADDTFAQWSFNDQGLLGRAIGPSWFYENATTPAFRINGTPTAVPEPSSLALLGIGCLTLVGCGRRRLRCAC